MQGARELLDEAQHYGTSPVRFVVAPYGGGKSHFLQAVLGEALERRFWCSYSSLEREAALKKLELEVLWKQLARSVFLPGMENATHLPGLLDHLLAEHGADTVREAAKRARLEPDLERALVAYAESTVTGQDQEALRYWLLGEPVRPKGLSAKIDANRAMVMLESLVSFVRALRYAGVVVALDELELAKDGTAHARARFYESLRQLIDRQVPGYVFYGASTPDMLSDPKGFPAHAPLWDRIRQYADQSAKVNPLPKQPVVYLDAVPLGEAELVEIGRRVRAVHAEAESWDAAGAYGDQVLSQVARHIANAQYTIGKPRWLVTTVVRDLDRKLHDTRFDPAQDLESRLRGIAEGIRQAEEERHHT